MPLPQMQFFDLAKIDQAVQAGRAQDTQNAFARMQMEQTQRQMQDDSAVRDVLSQTGGDYEKAQKALLGRGLYKPAMEMGKANLERQEKQATIDKNKAETALKHMDAIQKEISGIIANPTDEALAGAYGRMVQGGYMTAEQAQQALASYPTDMKARQSMLKFYGAKAEDLMKALTPQVTMVNLGGTEQAIDTNVNTNPTVVGQTFEKTATPGELMTDQRTKAEGAANRAVTMRGQNLTDARSRETNAKGHYDPERGVLVDPKTGVARPVTQDGMPIGQKDKPLTEYQGKSTAFGMRAAAAHDILNAVGADGAVQPGAIKRVAESVPLVGEGLGTLTNWTQSAKQQQVEQAQRDFINAILRQESGAVISPSEFANAAKQYFPQPGDSPAVIAQKKANRETAIKGFEIGAGPGAKNMKANATETDVPPNPAKYAGATMRDSKTGITYRSDGKNWVKVDK